MKTTRFLLIPTTLFIVLMLAGGCSREQATRSALEVVFSSQDEVQMGKLYAAQIDTTTEFQPIDSTSNLSKYIDSIGQTLVQSQKTRPAQPEIGLRYRFKIINKNVVNAFAVMGGHIYIYRGLIDSVNNEAELASVIAHELGHVTERHGVKQLVETYGAQTLLNVLLGQDNTRMKSLLGTLAGTKFSRNDEYAADSCGLAYMTTAGYNGFGMRNFFNTLKAQNRDMGSLESVFSVISTHPKTEDRISEVERILKKLGKVETDTAGFYQARLLAHRN